jgi:mannose-6-phosphate isomerase-like protein (cupin superfamily)
MVRGVSVSVLLSLAFFAPQGFAQRSHHEQIDMYFGDWRASSPRVTHGTLQERDILTRGDALNPSKKGGVLRFANSYTFATLAPNTSTKATRLDGQQEIFFIASGQGTATAGGETANLHKNVVILMPANLEFTLKSGGAEPLTMYVINEPIPAGFRPNSKMLVKDENALPITASSNYWSHIAKSIFTVADGLGTLEAVLTVTLDPMTIYQPHLAAQPDIEEIWTSLEGNSIAFLGAELRRQSPGIAYIHPPDSKTPHSNINQSEEEQIKFLYFARYHPHNVRQ